MKIKELETSIEYDRRKSDWTVGLPSLVSRGAWLSWPQAQTSFTFDSVFNGQAVVQYTDWSMAQLCMRLGIPVGYMRACPYDLRDTNINYWLHAEANVDRKFLVRVYGNTARAILSGRYAPIGNSRVLQCVSEVVDVEPKYRCVVTPDYLYLKIMAADTPSGFYAAGVVIQNGEIGNYALRIAPFVQKHSCQNSIVFMDGGFYMRHVVEFSQAYLAATVKEHVGHAMAVAPSYVDKVVAAELEEIPDISSVIDNICSVRGYTSDVKQKILIGTEGRSTKGAVAQGLSFAAHEVADDGLTMDLESTAGYYLTGKWVVQEAEVE